MGFINKQDRNLIENGAYTHSGTIVSEYIELDCAVLLEEFRG